jgi:hypothetical protein
VKFACSQKCYEHFWLFLSVHIPIFCWLDPWSWWVIFFFCGGSILYVHIHMFQLWTSVGQIYVLATQSPFCAPKSDFFPILGGLIFAERSPNANDGTIGRTTMAPQRLNPDFSLTMSCLNSWF